MEWSEIGRRLARHAGKQARLPSPSVVRRRFGSVDVAVRATQRWAARRRDVGSTATELGVVPTD